MPSNIEIKARLDNWTETEFIIREIADSQCEILEQEDIFFHVKNGRLKLRLFADGSADLIQYHRPNSKEAKQSTYSIYKTDHPQPLLQTLSDALGIRVIVKKVRHLYWVGQTRIHLDRVENLGNFIELEVVLKENQSPEHGHTIAKNLMNQLDIQHSHLIDVAYADLLDFMSKKNRLL